MNSALGPVFEDKYRSADPIRSIMDETPPYCDDHNENQMSVDEQSIHTVIDYGTFDSRKQPEME